MVKNTAEYIREYSERLFPRWYGMVAIIVGLLLTAIPIVAGLIKAEVGWGYIVAFTVALLLFIVCSFLLFRKVAIERDSLKWRDGIQFNSNRPAMDSFVAFTKKYDKIWAVYGTGESLESNKAYDPMRFERVILLDPNGKHMEKMKIGFYLNDQDRMRKK